MPSQFMFALDVQGVKSSSSPLNFIIGFTSESEMFVFSFPNTVSDYSSILVSQSGIQLHRQVVSFAHLKGSSIISIQYGNKLSENLGS